MKKVALTLIGGSSPGTKPIAISILTAVLKQAGHEVALFDTTYMDLGFPLDGEAAEGVLLFKPVDWARYGLVRDPTIDPEKEFLAFLDREQPDVIAASAISDMYPHTLRFLRLAKAHRDIPIIIGGIHATLQPQSVIAEDCIDALCIGEGEEALLEYLDALDGDRLARTDIKNLWIKQDGEIHQNPIRDLIEPDSLPFFDYSLFDERQLLRPYDGRVVRGGDYQDRRGCPRRCPYCAYATLNTTIYPQSRVKFYSPERFVEEAKYLKTTYDLEFFKFFSEDMHLRPLDELNRIAEGYAREVGLPFTTNGYPVGMTEEKARLFRRMNCVSMSVALECGNDEYRRDMLGRKYTVEDVARTVRILQNHGIRTSLLCMVGMPYEDRELIFETFDAARRIAPDIVNPNCFFPFRGVPLSELAVTEGLADPEVIATTRSQVDRCLINNPKIDAKAVEGIVRLHFFYLHWPKTFKPLLRLGEQDTALGRWFFRRFSDIQRTLNRLKAAL